MLTSTSSTWTLTGANKPADPYCSLMCRRALFILYTAVVLEERLNEKHSESPTRKESTYAVYKEIEGTRDAWGEVKVNFRGENMDLALRQR